MYIFLESLKPMKIKEQNFSMCDREITYFYNFLDPIYEAKRKIFMRKPEPINRLQTLHKLKDNINYIIDKHSYYAD